jgi:hypothetical protein
LLSGFICLLACLFTRLFITCPSTRDDCTCTSTLINESSQQCCFRPIPSVIRGLGSSREPKSGCPPGQVKSQRYCRQGCQCQARDAPLTFNVFIMFNSFSICIILVSGQGCPLTYDMLIIFYIFYYCSCI